MRFQGRRLDIKRAIARARPTKVAPTVTPKPVKAKINVTKLKDSVIAEYVSFYYIRNNYNQGSESIFPDSIKILLSQFLGCLISDEWDPDSINTRNNEKDKVIIYGNDNRCIKRWKPLKAPWGYLGYILGTKLVDFSYKWTLRILECEGEKFGSLIGIVPHRNIIDPENENKILITHRFDDRDILGHQKKHNGYGYWPYSKWIFHGETSRSYGDKFVHPYDIVEIDLNMKEQTLSFIVNGKNFGIAFENIAIQPYRLIVAFYNSDNVQLLRE